MDKERKPRKLSNPPPNPCGVGEPADLGQDTSIPLRSPPSLAGIPRKPPSSSRTGWRLGACDRSREQEGRGGSVCLGVERLRLWCGLGYSCVRLVVALFVGGVARTTDLI